MANLYKVILPYLNVLEVPTVDKINVEKVLVIDKDNEIKVMDGKQLGINSYNDLEFKPSINNVELVGNRTSAELDIPSATDITAEIENAISTKQDTLVSGTNIKTINGNSLLGSGNITTSGAELPYLVISSTEILGGDFNSVLNAIKDKTPYNIYYYNMLYYQDLMTPEVVFVTGSTIQCTFHFESGTTNHTLITAQISSTGVTSNVSYHNYVSVGTGTLPQVKTMVVLTQSEYDSLAEKDKNTQYLIVE